MIIDFNCDIAEFEEVHYTKETMALVSKRVAEFLKARYNPLEERINGSQRGKGKPKIALNVKHGKISYRFRNITPEHSVMLKECISDSDMKYMMNMIQEALTSKHQ